MKNQNKIRFWAETYILHVNSMHALYTYRRYAETYTLHTNSMHTLYPYGHYTETYIYIQTQCMHYIHRRYAETYIYTQTQCICIIYIQTLRWDIHLHTNSVHASYTYRRYTHPCTGRQRQRDKNTVFWMALHLLALNSATVPNQNS